MLFTSGTISLETYVAGKCHVEADDCVAHTEVLNHNLTEWPYSFAYLPFMPKVYMPMCQCMQHRPFRRMLQTTVVIMGCLARQRSSLQTFPEKEASLWKLQHWKLGSRDLLLTLRATIYCVDLPYFRKLPLSREDSGPDFENILWSHRSSCRSAGIL
jgi:hypothetical protein